MVHIIRRPRPIRRIPDATIMICLFCYAISSEIQCPEQELCRCKFYGKQVDLHCIGTEDLIELKDCLIEHFDNFSIRTLYVKQCNATSLPAQFIGNITVKMLYVKCPLLHFSVDAFVDSYRLLFQFRLFNHRLTAVPDAFTPTVELQRLWMVNGTLESVGDELKNLRNLRMLSLERNRIRCVSSDAFSSMTSLLEIYLSFNQINNMDSNTFSSCKGMVKFYLNDNYLESAEGLLDSLNPRVLYLYNNNLTDIHIFHPEMWRTTELRIGGNPVRRIDGSVFGRYLINVVVLDLSNMSLSDISENAFPAFPSLTTLDLSANKIENIQRKTFYNLKHMSALDLSHNQLSSIKGVFENHIKMSKLDISFNRIESLEDSLNAVPNLNKLSVKNNKIQALTDDNFRRCINLKVILALKNNISTMTKECFRYTIHLQEIELSSNSIVSLNGSIRDLPNLQKVHLAFNRIRALEVDDFANVPFLFYVNLMHNRLTTLNSQFRSLHNLNYLNLQDNRISTLERDIFPAIITIRALFLKGNPLTCDCRLEWLSLLSKRYEVLKDDVLCQAPYWLKGRNFHNLSVSELVVWKESCPKTCECYCLANGSEFGIKVDCSRRNLTEVPGTFPTKMIVLNLSENNIAIVRRPVLNGTSFDDLQELDIENNQVTTVEGLRTLKYLSKLKLANNSLETIAVNQSSNYSLVTLSGNPWLCDCSTLWFRSWMLSLKDEIPDINQTMCAKGNVKKELSDTPLIYLSESDICPLKVALYIFISIAILAFMLLVTSISFAYFRYRLNIKVWLYAHGFSCVKEEEIDKNKPFDAFISFSCRDERFVYRTLCPTLENDATPYFLCIHDRNFPAGENIGESILSAVKSSKRTILVLSKNYLESEWCTLEFRTAHLQALQDKINRVIIIIYGKLPPMKEIDEELQVYLKSTTYLIWGEKYFWQKLRYALPKVTKQRTREELHYDDTVNLLVGF